jgi:hypothetical protein
MKTNEALKTLDMLNKFKVIGMLQYRTLREFILQSEESDFFATTVDEVANRVADMPNLYAQDGEGKKAIAHLHYFLGNYDAWITELNLGTRIAFGKASFGGASEAEYGYISLQELFDNNVELDLYWTPKPIGEISENNDTSSTTGGLLDGPA